MGRTRRHVIAAVPEPDAATATLAPVDSLLWDERALLQRLLYQLSAQALVIGAGRLGWLHDSDVEVRSIVHELQLYEIGRAAETDALAACYGLSPNASLREIVAVVPEPWGRILSDHLHVLRELQSAVERIAGGNAALLRAARDRDESYTGRSGTAS